MEARLFYALPIGPAMGVASRGWLTLVESELRELKGEME